MKRKDLRYILKVLILFTVISFFIDKVIFFALNKISDQVYTGQAIGKLNHYLMLKDDLDFVVFGSSRANHNIDPNVISNNSFNMGTDGTMISYSSTLLKLLPKEKEQVVFFHIDTENAFSNTYTGKDIAGLAKKYNRNLIIKAEIDKLNQDNIFQRFYWSLSYNGVVLGILNNFFKPKYNYKYYKGYDPINLSESQKKIFEKILKQEEVQNCEKDFKLNEIYRNYLDELKFYVENNKNKKIVFFTSPKYNDACKEDNEKLKAIMDDKNLIYYDLTDFFKKNNSNEYWRDKTHLSSKGAELFTKEINDIYINIKI